MKKLTKIRQWVAALVALAFVAQALADPIENCAYSDLTNYGGKACHDVVPKLEGTWYHEDFCNYYFCDQNAICSTDSTKYTKKLRHREIWFRIVGGVVEYSATLFSSDTNEGCCFCITTYGPIGPA